MKNLTKTFLLVLTFSALAGCGESTFTANSGLTVDGLNYEDPITPYEEPTEENIVYTENHCQDINVNNRVFYGDLKSTFDQRPLMQLLEDYGQCTNQGSGVQSYTGFWQYEVNAGTNQCSWWSQHGMNVYVEFTEGYRQAAVVTIATTGDGWPQNGEDSGFPTSWMQFRNGIIDCNDSDLSISVEVQRSNGNGQLVTVGILKVTAPKESGNKYSSHFRGTVSYNGLMISKGLFFVTQ